MNKAFKMPEVKYSITRLGGGVLNSGASFPGGLDLTTPSLALQPGALRDCLNYECSQSGGYGRIAGYERFDGRSSPSSAVFITIQITSFTNVPTIGQTLTQAVSGATGTIIAINNVPGSCYMAVTKTTGTFDYTHNVLVGATPIGTAISPTVNISPLLTAQYLAAAADVYRALIGAVPGSGPIRGVVGMIFSSVDNVYAFRDNIGATAVAIYKASAAGWTLVPFFNIISFTAGGGGSTPLDGETLTQGANSATIKRVMWQSGAWAGTAVGQFVVTTPAPGNFVAGAAVTSGGKNVTLSGAQTAITLTPGGHFEFVKCNFSGQLVTRRLYGCDGVNQAFEFDGVTLAPIKTGLSPDVPSHLTYHKNFLFVAQGSSMSYCGAGTPFKWGATDGGGEIATGDTVNGMISLPGSQTSATLAIYMSGNTAFLYGIDPATFNFVLFDSGTGALPYSIQNLFDTCAFDNLGVITLKTTLNYGNFLPNSLTRNIQPFILQERTKISDSCVSRDKSQYRVFFNDGYGLWLTMVNQQYLGASVVQFPDPVYCIDEQNQASGAEVTYFGTANSSGYVMQLDKGTSFDGANLDAHITLAWDPFKSPRMLKRYRAASIEIQGTSYAAVSFGYQLGYGSTLIGQPSYVPYSSSFAAAPVWDTFTWDGFVWDGQTLTPTDVDMTGTGENVQVTISSTTNYIAAFQVNSIIYHYTPRRGMRV